MEENWTATELLSKIDVPTDVLMHIKTTVGEEMFDNFRMYYGDDPERYNLSFEVIFGTYCNRMEWVRFLETALAVGAHAIRFDDLNKMTTGKMLFYIQVPRVATGTGVPSSRQTTIMVTKHSEKSPITIPFELSAACLTHLKETFEETLLDKLLNVDALNTVLRAVKNTADAMERGLVHNFLLTLMRKAPPYFVTRTLLENSTIARLNINRVQRANILQSFKSKMVSTIFLLNRGRDRDNVHKFLRQMVEATTESILENPETYVISGGARLSGVIVSTPTVIQTILSLLPGNVSKEDVKAPASYGKFVMSKENAVTAIAHHAIMADFGAQADRIASGSQSNIKDPKFFDKAPSFAQVPMNVLRLGEKVVALEHLQRVYKNTDTRDPLERTVELTFFFPVGLYLSPERGYTTVENKVRLNETAQNNLPTCAFFYNKDRVLQRLGFSDMLRTLCHPLVHDAEVPARIFAERGPPTDAVAERQLCHYEFDRQHMSGVIQRCIHFYRRRADIPRTVNEIKQDFNIDEFYKCSNATLYTELHPFYDFTHHRDGGETVALCTPRVMLGNVPDALAPQDFHEQRARQIAEHTKLKFPPEYETALKMLQTTLTDPQYPELFYLIDVMIHGHPEAFLRARTLIARCISVAFHRGVVAFGHSFDMIVLIAAQLGDGTIGAAAHAIYRNIVATVRTVQRTLSLTGLNGRLDDEPLLSFVNALFDPRLLPPFLNALPRPTDKTRLVVNHHPIDKTHDIHRRHHNLSDVPRMNQLTAGEPLFADDRRLSDEDLTLHKIYYLCVVPALTNNRACGLFVDLNALFIDLFYREPFVTDEENRYQNMTVDAVEDKLLRLVDNVATVGTTTAADAARELFLLLPFMGENAKVLEIRAVLDPAQRHGRPDFDSLQFVLYNGCCAITAPRILRDFVRAVPFHRFYSDPNICAALHDEVREFLVHMPHFHRTDGGFPLPPAFAHEYHVWHRSPFFRYSANCPPNFTSVLTLGAMHQKLSPVSIALLSRLQLHPGFAVTAVRTDTFETESLLYTGKSCTALILNNPIVTKEERDIVTTYHVTQNINSVDMGLGYSSATCTAMLKRARSDMGSKTQDLFRVFPMHVHRNEEVDAWLRGFTGAERVQYLDTDAIAMLTFGGMTEKDGASLAHGQRSTCELVLTPVTADINYFKISNNPRGRSSCMLAVDPYDAEAADRALYDHTEPDAQTFYATNNPWASQRGSLGDLIYNSRNRDRLGYNSRFYSPCAQFFNNDEIVAANKTLFRTIDEYVSRSKDCIRGDTDVQYICVEGTDKLVEKPCTFLQESFPIQLSTTQALLETQAKGLAPGSVETHFGNYIIAEAIPFQKSILFNS